jgi:hypothetical protein
MKRKPFTRFYFPGLISLVFLPLMCIGYAAYIGKLDRWTMMDVAWSDDASIKDWNGNMKTAKIDIKTFKKFSQLTLTGNNSHDSATITRLKILCAQLISSNNKTGGVTVTLTSKSTYDNLVNVLDAGFGFDYKISFMPYRDKVFFYLPQSRSGIASPKENGPPFFICGNSYVFKPEPSLADNARQYLSVITPFWPAFIAFILMIFFSIRGKRNLQTAHR